MIIVPDRFRPRIPIEYPSGNKMIFEEWFYYQYKSTGKRAYLPVFFTSYYVKHRYGKDKNAIKELQLFLDDIDPDYKYFCLCQYDDGILNDISHLDIKVFAMSGNRIDHPLPLICQPAPVQVQKKIYFASFVGTNTHPIRKDVMALKHPNWYISSKRHQSPEYHKVLAQSVFALCPRGYGQSSFRIMEAVRQGAIPVYISDEHIIPSGYTGLVYPPDIDIFKELSKFTPEQIAEMQKRLKFEPYTYDYNRKLILSKLD